MDQMVVVMVAEVVQMIHRVRSSGGRRRVPLVRVVLRVVVQQVVVVMVPDQHRGRCSCLR